VVMPIYLCIFYWQNFSLGTSGGRITMECGKPGFTLKTAVKTEIIACISREMTNYICAT